MDARTLVGCSPSRSGWRWSLRWCSARSVPPSWPRRVAWMAGWSRPHCAGCSPAGWCAAGPVDHVTVRRYLVDEDLLTRENGEYWRTGGWLEVLDG